MAWLGFCTFSREQKAWNGLGQERKPRLVMVHTSAFVYTVDLNTQSLDTLGILLVREFRLFVVGLKLS